MGVDYNKLLACHQLALIEMANTSDAERRRWASERADFFAEQILARRRKFGAPHPVPQHSFIEFHPNA
jgi:hypothetical protein